MGTSWIKDKKRVAFVLVEAPLRVFAGCKPFIKERVDQFSEMSQWQIFFVMLAALLLRFAEMSGDFDIENKKAFDIILVGTQALAPAVIILMILIKGQDVTTKLARKITGSTSRGGRIEEESGLELAEMNSRTVLGGGG